MKPFSHAFEIAYGPSFEVLDHSEVFLDGLPGTAVFANKILPVLREKLNSDQFRRVEQSMALVPRIQDCVKKSDASETFEIADENAQINWHRPHQRTGIFSILVGDKTAAVSLLVCRCDDLEAADPITTSPLFGFMEALSRIVSAEEVYDNRKFQLITMTRRPLLASMFWPPFSPTEDSLARTIQLQIAYAFFRLHEELE